MPYVDSGAQDDVLAFDGTQEFSGGVDSYRSGNIIEQNQASELLNVDIARDGSAATRLGSEYWGQTFTGNTATSRIQGLFFYNTSTRTDLITARDGKLWWQNSVTNNVAWNRINYASTDFSFTNATNQIYFAQLSGVVFFSDGVQDLMYIEPNSSSLKVSTIPTDAIGGWRRPSKLRYLTSHAGRLLGVDSTYPDTIRVSEVLEAIAPLSWNSTNDITIGGDGDEITGMCSWTGTRLVVFKRNYTYVVECGDPDPANWIIQQVDGNIGCVAHRTICRVGADVYWLSANGVRTLKRTLAGTEQEISEPLSKPISSDIDNIYQPLVHLSAAVFYDNKYIVSFPQKSNGETWATVVYNTIFKCWSGKWTGIYGTCWTRYTNETIDHLMFGLNNGKVGRWLGNKDLPSIIDDDYKDFDVSYETNVTSREYTFGDYISDKSPFNIDVEFSNSQGVASVYMVKDSGALVPVLESVETRNLGLTLPFYLDGDAIISNSGFRRRAVSTIGTTQFRGIRIVVKSASGKLGVRRLVASAYIDTYKAQQ